MIGGHDIVFPAVGDSASLEACARIVRRWWPQVRFEDAVTGDKYPGLDKVPFGQVRELLAYVNADAEAAWDADRPDAAVNSMLYLVVEAEHITVVLDDPGTADVLSMLEAIRNYLWTDIRLNYARAA